MAEALVRKPLSVAVVGATGAVGRELLKLLEQRDFPIAKLTLFASEKSAGKALLFREKSHRCQALKPGCFEGVDVVFFDASDEVSRQWAPAAAESGAWVIDNSATFRMEPEVPLVVPEINGDVVRERALRYSGSARPELSARERILAGPNCSTVQLVLALWPLAARWGLERVVVSTYQSTSGAGTQAMEELSLQTVGMFNQKPLTIKAFPHQIAFNLIPQIGSFQEADYTSEENKIMREARKILSLPDLRITATAVRVPTFSCHAESVNVETVKPFELSEVRVALAGQAGVAVLDDPARKVYPLNVGSAESAVPGATGRDEVFVGRIRRDSSLNNGLNFWVVSDNLRKGAALNAVQIAEILLPFLG